MLRFKSCVFKQFTHSAEILAILRKISQREPIVFTGDSLVRNLFLRIVAAIRRQHTVFEHPFQTDARYIVTTHGDELIIVQSGNKLLIEKSKDFTKKVQNEFADLLALSEHSLKKLWENKEDDVWNTYLVKKK